ncbi:MAG: hypothetical protein WA990_02395 [Rubrobacteraceae bacterium]
MGWWVFGSLYYWGPCCWRSWSGRRPGRRGATRREERPVAVVVSVFEDLLRERLARGEISGREFEYALRQLRDS